MIRLSLFIGLLGMLAAPLGAAEARKGAPIEIKLATILPAGTSGHQRLMELRDTWATASAGAVKLTVYAGSADGEALLVRKLRARQIHAAVLSAVGLGAIDRSATSLQLMPMAFRTWEEVDYVREKIRGDLEGRLREKGFEVLFWGDAGWVRYFSKEPAVRPSEFKAMKMFVWSGEPQQLAILRSQGYQPVGLETEQILPSLSTGMISVVPVPPFLANALQYSRYLGHMVDQPWVPLVGAAIVRTDTWNQLSPALRAEFLKSAAILGEKVRRRSREEDDEAIAAMKKRGLVVHAVTPAITAEWQALAEGVYPKIRGAIVPADLFDRVLAHVAEFRAAKGAGK
jgi:TRAP-type C4-dicarboxylate transport system substrate-binding protein